MVVKTRGQFQIEQETAFADNSIGNITPAVLRAQISNLADSAIFVEDISTESSPGLMSVEDKVKLDGIQTGATVNSPDGVLTARGNHTGSQAASTISDFDAAVAASPAVTANSLKAGNATHIGDVTGSVTLTIAADAVTNTKLANMAANSIKGAIAAGDPADLTAAQVRTMLNVSAGATANASDATLLDRANHTGSQSSGTINDFAAAADERIANSNKVSSNVAGIPGATQITNMVRLTQAQYDAIAVKNASTFYVVTA